VIAALLSRSRVYALAGSTVPELVTAAVTRAAGGGLQGPRNSGRRSPSTRTATPAQAFTTTWTAQPLGRKRADSAAVEDAMNRKTLLYYKGGEEPTT